MASYQIVCVNTEHAHRHITAVGVLDHGAITRMTVAQVRQAIKDGDRFFTVSPTTHAVAKVRRGRCRTPGCHAKTLRSKPDSALDNNLDQMSACQPTA